jgi:hypothetical protein
MMENKKKPDERTLAVNRLVCLCSNPNVSPEEISKWEARAGMTPVERLNEIAKDDSLYKDDKLQQNFSSIRSIKAIKGWIVVDVDECDSRQAAIDAAFRVLGPLAPEADIKKYIAEHTKKTTMMSVRTFKRNLRTLAVMVAQLPQYFGAGKGGTAAKDLMKEGLAAIREAKEYIIKHANTIPPFMIEQMLGDELKTCDETKFATYLGEGWENMLQVENIETAKRLLKVSKD